MEIQTAASPLMWAIFSAAVLVMLALDLGVFHRKAHEVRFKEALTWSGVWVALALIFNGVVYYLMGRDRALEFLTGYLIEKALSVDNIFVFIVLFAAFAVPKALEHRVLFWGVVGALLMRAGFIAGGAVLLTKFHWVIYVFGAILIITGVKMLFKQEGSHPERNPAVLAIARIIPTTSDYRGGKFAVREAGRWLATPLLIVLVAIEITDLVFAVDSIPAIFAVTNDPFIVYTSNVFAILGLRALYFVLAGVIEKFHLLRIGLAGVLMFVGAKMLIVGWYKIPIFVSLGVIVALLGGSVVASLLIPPRAVKKNGAIDETEHGA